MALPASFSMVHTLDQWRRVAHHNTSLQETTDNFGVLQLSWITPAPSVINQASQETLQPAGMAFDPWCRLYRARPELGQVEKWLDVKGKQDESEYVFEQEKSSTGQFSTAQGTELGPLQHPVALVVDDEGRIFVAEAALNRVIVFDLHEKRLVRFVGFNASPVRLATNGKRVYALLSGSDARPTIAIFDAHSSPRFIDLPEIVKDPGDLVVGLDIYMLDKAGTKDACIVPFGAPETHFAVPFASAIALAPDNVLVVARQPGDDFLRFRITLDSNVEMPYLHARHYDGRGIVTGPTGEIGYWSDKGFLYATVSRVRFKPEGTIVTFQLDSHHFQTQWGRIFIDACLPRGTEVTARYLVLDELPDNHVPIVRSPPEHDIGVTVKHQELSPPMPPQNVMDTLAQNQVFRRHSGNEFPWQHCDFDDQFRTFESPVAAPPGRYLWIALTLKGTSRKTPRIKRLRAETTNHDLLKRLPQVFSNNLAEADFLRRFLAMPEGIMRDLDLKATYRHILLNPYATPPELLPWLGSFLGLMVDARWSEAAKRELISNGIWLFRFRGTLPGIKRLVEIYLNNNIRVTIIEHFKVRGLGGAFLGDANQDALLSNAVLGAGFRVGGAVGKEDTESINEVSVEDAITLHAHRFSLVIAAKLDPEQLDVIAFLLDTHRPAHTLFDVCTVDSGMQVGKGLHLGLTSIVGQPSGFGELQIGGSILGHTDTLGKAKMGTAVGSSRLGGDSHVG